MEKKELTFNMSVANLETNRQHYIIDMQGIVYLIGMITVGIVAILGNVIVVKIIVCEKRIRSAIFYLIANMALSDAICGVNYIKKYNVNINFHLNIQSDEHHATLRK
ncbi:hypothetical protein B4U80_14900 [Leptotrombidium deliense]|uniref:G-protein coupled receptors family 1 profile domain-containing protein n=1 Tax=Leptotrombidium deliense TaxID=299467 RepID=A0A443S441_9ACAR|nr:hypothetical protein B4U80_14900 [Leptotrombidium deliense]